MREGLARRAQSRNRIRGGMESPSRRGRGATPNRRIQRLFSPRNPALWPVSGVFGLSRIVARPSSDRREIATLQVSPVGDRGVSPPTTKPTFGCNNGVFDRFPDDPDPARPCGTERERRANPQFWTLAIVWQVPHERSPPTVPMIPIRASRHLAVIRIFCHRCGPRLADRSSRSDRGPSDVGRPTDAHADGPHAGPVSLEFRPLRIVLGAGGGRRSPGRGLPAKRCSHGRGWSVHASWLAPCSPRYRAATRRGSATEWR